MRLVPLALAGERADNIVSADITWSDPVMEPGMRLNITRQVGTLFGPDVTQVSELIRVSFFPC